MFSIRVFLSLTSVVVVTTAAVRVVVVVGGRVVVVVVVVDVVVTTTSGSDVEARAMSALQGVSLHTRRSLLPPRQAAPPPAAAVNTPRLRTYTGFRVILLMLYVTKLFTLSLYSI